MNHLFVDRRADRRRIPVIPLERRRRSGPRDPLLGQLVELRRAHARRDLRRQLGQHLADQAPGIAHPLELGRRSADDHRPAPAPTARRRPPWPAPRRHHRATARRSPNGTSDAHGSSRGAASSSLRYTAEPFAARPLRCRRIAAPSVRRTSRARRATRSPPRVVAFAPHCAHTRRDASRLTSSSSGTSMSTTMSGERPFIRPSSACACATVRGNPSRMNPAAASGRSSRSLTIPIITSSLTSSPRSMMAFARSPISRSRLHGLPQDVAGRDLRDAAASRANRSACVPFPAPGAPSMIRFSAKIVAPTLVVLGCGSSS